MIDMPFQSTIDSLLAFAYYYPLFMSYVWMCGGLYYRFHWERGDRSTPPALKNYPGVSVLVPCFNEAEQIEETLRYLALLDYPNVEIICINDGSRDNTGAILDAQSTVYSNLRVVHLATNSGKAKALNVGALLAKNEILVCIDSDAVLDPSAVIWLISHFENSPRLGAVTGNPRIRNRSTLLGKIQVGEFSSIIGLIKRAQRIYGRIFTVSGVVVAFRRAALQRIGFWHSNTVTDDIDVSWRLQLDHWDVRYEPNALCWILMPETYTGLWRQRLRWARGGAEAALRYAGVMAQWRSRRMWLVFIEYWLSVVWSYVLAAIVILWLLGKFVTLPEALHVPTIVPGWHGVVLASTCLLQFFVSLVIDGRYEPRLLRNFFWMIWYPLAYWLITVFTTVVAVPRTIFNRKHVGTWVSPDRGVRAAPVEASK
ncbi:MAG: poly-beta,6 N-acetyl-D-glucosamine synthase [Verrucomicrobiaceae bacterium]|nr:poly-beta,6 N-acetyl-D-glucosamine synthase [Verrucomicrobiaceae bacterium]